MALKGKKEKEITMSRFRSETLKKMTACFMAFAMVITCGAFNVTFANAAVGQEQPKKGEKITKFEPGEYKDGEVLIMYSDLDRMNKKEAGDALSAAAAEEPAVKGFSVKKIWSFDTENDSEAVMSAQSSTAVKGKESYANVALLDIGNTPVNKAIEILNKDDGILYAEPNFKLHASAVTGADDPYVDRQWGLDNVNADAVWNKARGTDYGVVAVVDTGVDYTHEDLQGNVWNNPYINKGLRGEHGFNFIDGSKEPMDDNGHGSHCSGIIAAAGNNDKGICGITGADGNGGTRNNLDIMALKILDEEGSGYGAEEVAAYNYINKALDFGANIVAINNSYGGGEYSEIMEKLITIVGEKGAISVMAAGNDGVDIEEYAEEMEEHYYPVEYDSNYKIVVAATKRGSDNKGNELVSFSNYNKNMVDLAAPGTDILSTVCYNCYNPELYSVQSGVNNEAFKERVRAEDFTCGEGVTLENCKGINGTDTAIRFTVHDADKDVYAACMEYTLDKTEFNKPPYCNMTVKYDAAPEGGMFGSGYMNVFDTPADVDLDDMTIDKVEEFNPAYSVVSGKTDYWVHETGECCWDITHNSDEDEEDVPGTETEKRKLWIALEGPDKGDFEICIDNLGVSNSDQVENFGKYDYYSGTSMACPQVTGATALINLMQQKNSEEYNSLDVVANVISATRQEKSLKNKVSSSGILDFSQERNVKALIISKIQAGKGKVTINGAGFTKFDSLQIRIGNDIVDESKIASCTNTKIVINDKNNKWINDRADVEITGTFDGESKTAVKKNVYLADSKNSFGKAKSLDYSSTGIATNGRYLYTTSSASDCLLAMNPAKNTDQDEVVKITNKDLKRWFKTYESKDMGDHDFVFGNDLVYMNGRLFTFADYAEIGDNYAGSFDDWSAAMSEYDEDDDDYDTVVREKDNFQYFKETVLLQMNPSTEKAYKISMPKGIEDVQDYTMAAYNGKLYVMGGFKYEVSEEPGQKPVITGSFNRNVYTYSPSTKKWTTKKNVFPADRAGGKAIQTGNYLVYTLGYGDGALSNIVFNGKSWKQRTAKIEPYVEPQKVSRCGQEYDMYSCGIGLYKSGIVYSGLNVKDYGDTFKYNVSGDSFWDTGYNFRPYIPDEVDCISTVVGDRICNMGYDYFEEEDVFSSVKAVSSGLLKVTTSKKGKGSITSSRSYVPGSTAKVKVKAKKGYYISKIKVGSKTYKYGKKTKTKTVTASRAIVKNVTVRAYFKKR